jgi:hypothetical protein
MPPERKSGAAVAGQGKGTFDEMYTAAVQPAAGSSGAWSRPRPVPVEELGEDLSSELARVLERDYSAEMVGKVFDALDHVAPRLPKTNDQAVYILMVRRSYGRGQKTCLVNLPLFADLTNLSVSGVQYALGRLVNLKLIKKAGERIGKGKAQGSVYEVRVPVER